jgi:hypothetical protein
MNAKVIESTVYENCIGVKEVVETNSDLTEFLDMEDDDSSDTSWKKHWVEMPEFEQEDNPPYKKLIISFRNKEDFDEFVSKTSSVIDQTITNKTKSIWYPALDRDENSLKRWLEE